MINAGQVDILQHILKMFLIPFHCINSNSLKSSVLCKVKFISQIY